jgi:tripartite-type tricarboxylate transporter receptor subunit TctC
VIENAMQNVMENVMKLRRRTFLHLAAGAAALPTVAGSALAQTYPSRPVHLIVGFAAGGGTDIAARLTGQWLSERLGKSFIVENRPGAGSSVAAEAVVNASPDGYTLLVAGAANAVNATLYDKLNFNFTRDTVPVAGILSSPLVMVVNPSFPATTVRDFIAYARAHPGKMNMASAGVGSATHMTGELFKMMTGLDMPHVPYRGAAPAIADLLGGQVQVIFADFSAIEQIKAGKLRALGVTTAQRAEALPDVPTVGDAVPGYEASGWYGVVAPRNTPADIVDTLNREINAVLADPKLKARFADLGATPLAVSPADFGKLIAKETEKWGKVVRFAGIKPE